MHRQGSIRCDWSHWALVSIGWMLFGEPKKSNELTWGIPKKRFQHIPTFMMSVLYNISLYGQLPPPLSPCLSLSSDATLCAKCHGRLDCPEALMFLRLLEGAFEAMPQTSVQGIVLYEDRPWHKASCSQYLDAVGLMRKLSLE